MISLRTFSDIKKSIPFFALLLIDYSFGSGPSKVVLNEDVYEELQSHFDFNALSLISALAWAKQEKFVKDYKASEYEVGEADKDGNRHITCDYTVRRVDWGKVINFILRVCDSFRNIDALNMPSERRQLHKLCELLLLERDRLDRNEFKFQLDGLGLYDLAFSTCINKLHKKSYIEVHDLKITLFPKRHAPGFGYHIVWGINLLGALSNGVNPYLLEEIEVERINVSFDNSRGFYIEPYKEKSSYPVKKKRHKIIEAIKNGQASLKDIKRFTGYTSDIVVNNAIGDINKLFKAKLGMSCCVITHVPTGGYAFCGKYRLEFK